MTHTFKWRRAQRASQRRQRLLNALITLYEAGYSSAQIADALNQRSNQRSVKGLQSNTEGSRKIVNGKMVFSILCKYAKLRLSRGEHWHSYPLPGAGSFTGRLLTHMEANYSK